MWETKQISLQKILNESCISESVNFDNADVSVCVVVAIPIVD